jgi:hypothetical protein
LLTANVLAQAATPVDPTLDRLSHVAIFAFGGVGFAGVTSEGEKDFRTVLARRSALPQFEQVFATGNLQAKAYALIGIRRYDLRRYNELSAPMHDLPQKITVFRGCIGSHEPFYSLLKSIDAGDYDPKK